MSRIRTLIDDKRGVALMGILNRTPDSFSDGGLFLDDTRARARVVEMQREGAAIIDVGAESTRPRSERVSDDEQLARLGDIVRVAAALPLLVSIDTNSPAVADRALADGACVINATSLEPAHELARVAARHGAALILMHSRGSMTDMKGFSVYDDRGYGDVVADVCRELADAAERALSAGLPREDVFVDPGLGFAKNARQSLELCARLDEVSALGFPVVVGPSRKSFLVVASGITPEPPPEARLGAGIAASLACVERGARVLRTHDVAPVRQALAVAAALRSAVPRRAEITPEARHA